MFGLGHAKHGVCGLVADCGDFDSVGCLLRRTELFEYFSSMCDGSDNSVVDFCEVAVAYFAASVPGKQLSSFMHFIVVSYSKASPSVGCAPCRLIGMEYLLSIGSVDKMIWYGNSMSVVVELM